MSSNWHEDTVISLSLIHISLYIQSMIPELAELTTYLMNLISVSRVQRNPTVKTEIKMRNFEANIPRCV